MRSFIEISGVYIPILTKQNAHVCENWEKWIRLAKYVDREGQQSEQESKNVPESEADGKLNVRQSRNKEVCNIPNCPRIPEWPYILMRPQENLSKKLPHEKLEIGSQCKEPAQTFILSYTWLRNLMHPLHWQLPLQPSSSPTGCTKMSYSRSPANQLSWILLAPVLLWLDTLPFRSRDYHANIQNSEKKKIFSIKSTLANSFFSLSLTLETSIGKKAKFASGARQCSFRCCFCDAHCSSGEFDCCWSAEVFWLQKQSKVPTLN